MTRLLVSIRNLQEARIAVEAGADLIDLKEPRRGSLGASDADTISSVIEQFGKHLPISVALGELQDEEILRLLPHVCGAQFAKAGLEGCAAVGDWQAKWQARLAALPHGTQGVGVIYADNERAASPEPDAIVRLASQVGCAAVLVDTFDKSAGPLTAIWDRERINSFILQVQELGMLAVLAGSLGKADVSNLLPLRPDIVAVRGAVCRTTRTSAIDARKIVRLKALLADGTAPGSGLGTSRQLA